MMTQDKILKNNQIWLVDTLPAIRPGHNMVLGH